jgi:hypothetical protein
VKCDNEDEENELLKLCVAENIFFNRNGYIKSDSTCFMMWQVKEYINGKAQEYQELFGFKDFNTKHGYTIIPFSELKERVGKIKEDYHE